MDPLLTHRAPDRVVWWQPTRGAWDQARAAEAGRAYGDADAEQIAYGITAQHPHARIRVTTVSGELCWDTGQLDEELDAELLDGRDQPPTAEELPRSRRRGGFGARWTR